MSCSVTKTSLKPRLFLVVTALALGHLITFWLLAHPYRFFPCDDRDFYKLLQPDDTGFQDLISSARYQPVFIHYLSLCRLLWKSFSADSPSLLIFANLVANTISLCMIVLTCRRLTSSLLWSVAAGLIFAGSAWTANYYFMFSYAPFAVSLVLTAFTLQIYGAESNAKSTPTLFAASGLLLGLAFWSSPSAAVSIALVLAGFPVVLWLRRRSPRQITSACTWLASGFILTISGFSLVYSRAYLAHILENIHTDHYLDAIIKFGSVPPPPFLSFFRILFEYSPFEAVVFPILTTVAVLSIFGRRSRTDQALRICVFLAALCFAHSLTVDLLPTTKLGRTHFHAYPFLVIFIVVAGHWVYSKTSGGFRKIFGAVFTALLLVSMSFSIKQTMQTRATRFAVPEFLAGQPQTTNIYLILEDPHANYISDWLDDPRISFISNQSLGSMLKEAQAKSPHGMLIIGPTGPGSGNSILERGTLPDFNPMIPDDLTARLNYLPYCAFHPSFLFEEENCLALYFSGETPLSNNQPAMIKILSW